MSSGYSRKVVSGLSAIAMVFRVKVARSGHERTEAVDRQTVVSALGVSAALSSFQARGRGDNGAAGRLDGKLVVIVEQDRL